MMNTKMLIDAVTVAERAKSLAETVCEMQEADALLDTDALESDDMQTKMTLYELLRKHNRCSNLAQMLVDVLEHLTSDIVTMAEIAENE